VEQPFVESVPHNNEGRFRRKPALKPDAAACGLRDGLTCSTRNVIEFALSAVTSPEYFRLRRQVKFLLASKAALENRVCKPNRPGASLNQDFNMEIPDNSQMRGWIRRTYR
jgi:hypothetical protein